MRRVGTLALALIALVSFTSPAQAILVSLDFSITFDPPAGSGFADGTLTGALQLFVATPGGASLPVPFGAAIPTGPIAPGGTFFPPDPIHPPDPVAPAQVLLFTFAGLVHPPEPVFPPDPVFAYPPDPIAPDGPPLVPPFITLGSFTGDLTALNATGPLYAFASPGTQVGTYEVTVQQVPMPGTWMLLVAGSAGLAALGGGAWRTRRVAA